MKLDKIIASKEAKVNELRNALIETDSKEQRMAIGETLSALQAEIAELMAVEEKSEETPVEGRSFSVVGAMKADNGVESRAADFANSGKMSMETRSVLVSSGSIATPTEVSGINDAQNIVSSIVDMVKVSDCEGMGSYRVAYQTGFATAATVAEGAAITEGDPMFGFVDIKPTSKALLSYVSNQVQKQSPLNYKAKVEESALASLRKAASAMIVDAIVASDLTDALDGVAKDEKTLRKIALTYGGNENVMGEAVLFINKTDLIALGDVRGADLNAVYEITPDASNPNVGMIKDGGLAVKYCICSDLTAGTVLYGQPKNCELALFSNYDIRVSDDFAFNKNMLAVRGTVDMGADVVAKGGFVKATLA